jgi:hypothetical protein
MVTTWLFVTRHHSDHTVVKGLFGSVTFSDFAGALNLGPNVGTDYPKLKVPWLHWRASSFKVLDHHTAGCVA